MSAIRLPLLCAFAGGCLSSAVLFGIWRADSAAVSQSQQPRVRTAELAAASVIDTGASISAGQRRAADHGLAREPAAATQAEPSAAEASERKRELASAPASKDAQDVASPGGSAVSDVLTDLEAAYRQRLIAAARAEADALPEPAPAAVAVSTAVAPLEPPPEVATRAVAPVVPVSAPAAVAASQPPNPPPSEVPAAPPVLVAQNDTRPPDIHIGDVNQNTYNITNVRQGDVYVTQQLAMLQYMQFLGASATTGVAQPLHTRGLSRGSAPQFRQFPSTLTNLDNPWGFNFAPPNLVH